MTCPVCGGRREVTHQALVLQRHDVTYHRCPACEFWGTQEPFWLDEAYSSAIASTDTGLVARNVLLARRIPPLLARLDGGRPARYVDWAGGYGLFVRMMRDQGFDFLWQDDHADNVLAGPHAFSAGCGPVEAVTAFEVFEHVPDPLAFVTRVLEETGSATLIFSTELHDGSYDPAWWYLSPETGQHISFYSRRTLEVIARRLGLRVLSYQGVHLFTSRRLHSLEYAALLRASSLVTPLIRRRRKPLTWADHAEAVSRLAAGAAGAAGR